jgi:hypothetical protein
VLGSTSLTVQCGLTEVFEDRSLKWAKLMRLRLVNTWETPARNNRGTVDAGHVLIIPSAVAKEASR